MNLNRKGQVLVAFIIIMPLMLLLIVNVIDIGLYGIEKNKINDSAKSSVRYGLKNISDENIENKIRALLLKDIDNISENDMEITVDNNYVRVKVNKKYNPLFKLNNYLSTEVSYYGTVNDSKIEIKKE